jgi:hypothetical protein
MIMITGDDLVPFLIFFGWENWRLRCDFYDTFS